MCPLPVHPKPSGRLAVQSQAGVPAEQAGGREGAEGGRGSAGAGDAAHAAGADSEDQPASGARAGGRAKRQHQNAGLRSDSFPEPSAGGDGGRSCRRQKPASGGHRYFDRGSRFRPFRRAAGPQPRRPAAARRGGCRLSFTQQDKNCREASVSCPHCCGRGSFKPGRAGQPRRRATSCFPELGLFWLSVRQHQDVKLHQQSDVKQQFFRRLQGPRTGRSH